MNIDKLYLYKINIGAEYVSKRKKGYLEMVVALLIILATLFILDIAKIENFIIIGIIFLFNIFLFELFTFIKR